MSTGKYLAGGAVVLGVLYLLTRTSKAATSAAPPPADATPSPTKATFSVGASLPLMLMPEDGAKFIAVTGQYLKAVGPGGKALRIGDGVANSNPYALQPTDSTFVYFAKDPGIATLTGFIWDAASQKAVPVKVVVTIITGI